MRVKAEAVPKRKSTVADVAGRAGVSTATVSRVLAGSATVAPATRDRVMAAVRELDYVVNAHARSLTGQRSGTVALLLNDLTAPFFNHVAHGVEEQALLEDRVCIIGSTHGNAEREMMLAGMMREQNVDAVVLVGGVRDDEAYRERIARLAQALDASGARLALCGRPSPGEGLAVTVVDYDNRGGAFAAVSHLLSFGHERILFLGGDIGTTVTGERYRGYVAALEAYGVPLDESLVVEGVVSRAQALAWMKQRLERGPLDFTAVFGNDDSVAVGAGTALRRGGVRLPDEVSIVGYNDDPGAEDFEPALTTVRIPSVELGRQAVRSALHRDDPGPQYEQHIMLATHVVLRDSVRPVVRRR